MVGLYFSRLGKKVYEEADLLIASALVLKNFNQATGSSILKTQNTFKSTLIPSRSEGTGHQQSE
jgi:hypothetical protein